MNDEIYCFKAPGLSTIIMHKRKASTIFELVSANEEEEESLEISKKMKSELKDITGIKENYLVLDEKTIEESIIPTLNEILVGISPHFKTNRLATAVISNIVTYIATSKVSMLQVALGLFLKEQKIINCFQELDVSSSYDEVRRFKISAAHHASKKNMTAVNYKPLINKTPSDPSTILTAMCDVESASKKAGQKQTVFTCDQQLYRVTMDIIWNDPARWENFYPRIGGMHWLMSFVGSVGKLMKNSGLDKLLKSGFAGVEKMLTGKKYPMNVRALRIVAFELLRDLVDENMTEEDLVKALDDLSEKSMLAEHWIKNLIDPVFLMMKYLRAEREGEFGLHLYCCQKMIPYFFAAGHWNYARDGIVYLRSMQRMPTELLKQFMKGEHVVRLKEGRFNGINGS